MKLTQFANHLAGSPVVALLDAELTRQAALILRDPKASPAKTDWAEAHLEAPRSSNTARALLLTNASIAAALEAGNTPSDADIEYVVVNEILPVLAKPGRR